MAFDPARNPSRNRYHRSIEDQDPPKVVVCVMKAHVESEDPIGNDAVRQCLVDAGVTRAANRLHTDKTNACEQAGLLERISENPTLRRATPKGRLFYERHRNRLSE